MKRLASILLVALVLVGLAAACGQKGPLYLPEQQPAKQTAKKSG